MIKARFLQHALRITATTTLLFSCAWPVSSFAEAEIKADEGDSDRTHTYRWKLRGSAWFAMVDGDFHTTGRFGNKIKVGADDDLDYQEPYITPIIEGAFRYKKHDFWVTATLFSESESSVFNKDIEFGDVIFPISVPFKTKLELTDVNFRYGYAPRTIEDDGYRLGPYLGVSYTHFKFSGAVTERPIKGGYEDTFPVPTVGAYGEVPFGKTLLSADVGGIWFKSGKYEGVGVRGQFSATYRFREHVGLFAGIYGMYVDLDLDDEKLDDLFIWGPNVGLELRF